MAPGNDAQEVELELLGVNEEVTTIRRRKEDGNAWKMPIETFTSHLRDDDSLRGLKWKQKEFYRNQNEFINSLIEVEERTRDGRVVTEEEEEEEQRKKDKHAVSKNIAIYGSVAANVFLLILKVKKRQITLLPYIVIFYLRKFDPQKKKDRRCCSFWIFICHG